jgi:hypothetical protein
MRRMRSALLLAASAVALLGAAGKTRPVKPAAPVLPALSVTGFSIAEGDSGTTTATFVVGLSARSPRAVIVDYATRDGSAIAASGDYTPVAGRLTLDAGATSATIDVQIHGDAVEEPDETFTLRLRNPAGARLTVAEASGEIVDDDGGAGPGAGPELSIRDARASEGDSGRRPVRFTVTLSSPARHEVTVDFTTADGSASAGDDYEATSGQLRLPPGATSRSLAVNVLGDAEVEGDEDFVVELSNPVGAGLGRSSAHGLILDDDGPGAVSLEPLGGLERRAVGGQTVVLQVRVRSAAGEPVAGARVQWSIDGAGDLLDGATTTSDGAGVAGQRVRLRPAAPAGSSSAPRTPPASAPPSSR